MSNLKESTHLEYKDLKCYNCKHNDKLSCPNKDLKKEINIIFCGGFKRRKTNV